MTGVGRNQEFQLLCERLIGQHWDFYPTAGSRIGRHQYDGRLPDLSPVKLLRREQELRNGLADLQSVEYGSLTVSARMNYQMMELFLKRELFTFTELRPMENNPMRQSGFLSMSGYMLRDYAPLEERLRSATTALTQVPDFLDTLDRALTNSLSSHIVDMSVESYAGMARFYRVNLAPVARSVADSEIARDFGTALTAAAASLDGFVERL